MKCVLLGVACAVLGYFVAAMLIGGAVGFMAMKGYFSMRYGVLAAVEVASLSIGVACGVMAWRVCRRRRD